jgi:hypothetical protein
MLQQGQVSKLRSDSDEKSLWAYRFRVGGRGSRRVQRVDSRRNGTRARRSSGCAAGEAAGPR